MLADSGSKISRKRRIFAPAMPLIVASSAQSRRKSEIAVRQQSPGFAVRRQSCPSLAVRRRFPVFAAVAALVPRVARNALARRIRVANARLRGSQ